MEGIVKEMEDALQRKKTIKLLIEKRFNNFDYFKRIMNLQNEKMNKKIHWLNIVYLTPSEILNSIDFSVIQKRARMWFILGVNLSPILRIVNTPTYIRSLAQMMEEFEYYVSTNMKIPYLGFHIKKQLSVNLDNEYEAVKPKLHKNGNNVEYEFLDIVNIPCELDYFEIIFALTETLKHVYAKFDDECCSNKHIYETIIKLDSRLKNHFFGILEKELNKLAKKIVKEQMEDVYSVFNAWEPLAK
jgi:hypothetical protein